MLACLDGCLHIDTNKHSLSNIATIIANKIYQMQLVVRDYAAMSAQIADEEYVSNFFDNEDDQDQNTLLK